MTTEHAQPFAEWAILELMGHRRLGGYVTEQVIAGAAFVRIDVPGADGTEATQLYSPQAVYCITPTTQELATQVGQANRPAPVHHWELPATSSGSPSGHDGDWDND